MENTFDNTETDSNHNHYPAETISQTEAKTLVDVVKDGKFAAIKSLVESGVDLNDVDAGGDTALHVAIADGQYNTAVLLLNRGCSLEIRNRDGLTSLQLAERIEGRTVFVMAIQLTKRNRSERRKEDVKQRLVQEEIERQISEEMDTLDSEEENEKDLQRLSSRLMTSQQNLSSARKLVTNLEDQVKSAKSLVNNLELEMKRLQRELEENKIKKKRNKKAPNSNRVPCDISDNCSICLEVPKPPLKVFQCPEGHVFCEICKARPEMTYCPECRVSLVGVQIRNRTLEKLILFSTKS